MTNEGAHIGSAVRIREADIRQRVTGLRNQALDDLRSTSDLRELQKAHNTFTAYTSLLLLHATGHRPVRDPFCDPRSQAGSVVLISDKVVSERHRTRLAVLPDTALTQISHYHTHLQQLSHRLKEDFPDLAGAIAEVGSDQGRGLLPQLLFLDLPRSQSVTPATLAANLGRWPWPLNAGRHLIWDHLWAQGVSPALIRHQLGQLGWGERPFDSDAAHSPATFQRTLADGLENLLEKQGWTPLPGLVPLSAPPKPPHPSRNLAREEVHQQRRLGPEKRAHDREQRWEAARKEIRDRLEHSDRPIEELLPKELEQLVSEVEKDLGNQPELASRARTVLTRLIRRLRPDLRDGGTPGRAVVAEGTGLPFPDSWPRTLERAWNIRQRFLDHLHGRGNAAHRPSADDRLAEIIVSAAVVGGVGDGDRLKRFPKILQEGCWAFPRVLVLEDGSREATQLPAWRWIPDSLSASLITGWLSITQSPAETGDKGSPNLRALLQNLGLSIGRQNPHQILAELGQALARYQYPGFVGADGQRSASPTPLPASALWRLLTHKRQAPPDQPAQASEPPPGARTRLARAKEPTALTAARSFLADLRTLLREVEALEAHGNQRGRAGQKRALRQRLAAAFPSDHGHPPVAVALGEWGLHLTRHGSRSKKDLAFSTIARYLRALATPLLELAHGTDFFQLPQEDLEELYRDILTYPKRDRERAYLGERLREFHAFLETHRSMPAIDWSFLPKSHPGGMADAQLLTPVEYKRAFRYLVEDPYTDERTRSLQTALLLLGYRFGLRIGEAIRLSYRDLMIHTDEAVAAVHTRPNPYGYNKSPSGKRIVPCLESLPPGELRLLATVREWAGKYPEGDQVRSGLFVNPSNPGQLLDTSPLVDRVQEALRLASGEPRLRYHHLRHTFANRVFMGITADQWAGTLPAKVVAQLWPEPPEPVRLRRWLTGQTLYGEDTLSHIARLLGHRSFATTAQHYLHFPEIVSQGRAEADLPEQLSISLWAYALWTTPATVKKRRSRGSKGHHPPVPTNWPQEVDPPQVIAAKGRPAATLPRPKVPKTEGTLKNIDQVLSLARQQGADPQPLAGTLGLERERVLEILESARAVAEESGFTDLKPAPPENPAGGPGLAGNVDRASKRFWGLVESLEQHLGGLDRSTLKEGMEAWSRHYCPQERTATYWRLSDLEKPLEVLHALGVASDLRLKVVVSPFTPGYQEVEHLATKLGIGINRVETPLSPGKSGALPGEQPWVAVDIRPGKGKRLTGKPQISRLMFIIAIRLRIEDP